MSRPAGRSKRIFTKKAAKESGILSGRWVGSFSEDRPLGWDPVAEGNRAGDGMACNSNDRRQWRKQEVAVGTAASRMRVLLKARSIRWVPQPVLVSEEKATDTLAIEPLYFRILCKVFMPSSKRLRKASTSSGVLSPQKETRMAVSMDSGSLPMAASVWLGWPRPQALAEET